MNARLILSWVLIVPVALLFGLAGLPKLGGAAGEMFMNWGYPAWFALVIGALESVGAVGLLLPKTMRWGVYLMTVIMIGAAITHLINGEGLAVLRPTLFAGAMWLAFYLRSAAKQAPGETDNAVA